MKKILFCSIFLLIIAANSLRGQSQYLDAKVLMRHIRDNKLNPGTLSEEEQAMEKTLNDLIALNLKNDAVKIDTLGKRLEAITKAHNDSVLTVLKRYFPGIDNMTTDQVNALFDLNPFLKELTYVGSPKALLPKDFIKSAASSVGGLDVTNIANAVADIMIERAKQELTVAFFERFKTFAEKNPEFGILFPKTTYNLKNLLSYKYPEMLPALRSGFLEDIRLITYHLDDVLELPRYKEFFKNFPEATIAIRSLRLVHELESGASNAADVIKEFASFPEWITSTGKIRNLGLILKISAFFSESIRSNKDDEVWVSAKQLKQLFYDETLFKIYLGLLFEVAKRDNLEYVKVDGTSIPVTKMLEDHQSDLMTIQGKLKQLVDLTERVNISYRYIHSKDRSSLTNEDYYSYINTSLDVVEYGFSLTALFGEDFSKAQEALSILREANDLYRNIYTKEYNQAIVNTIEILTTIQKLAREKSSFVDASALVAGKITELKLPDAGTLKKADNKYTLVDKEGKETKSFDSLDKLIKSGSNFVFISSREDSTEYPLSNLLSFINKVAPYALFIANMVEAETEEQIKNAIENAILPVGSSSIKKHAVFNICIQSYLGARLNLTESSSAETAWNNPWGITAPIGVAFSTGGKKLKNPSSFSVFVSLLDIGAIVDYELTKEDNGETTQDYEVRLAQIFAPGAYLVWGFPGRIPLAAGIGTQYGPGLYKVNNGIETIDPDWNFKIFLAVDIPFFNLHNNPRTK